VLLYQTAQLLKFYGIEPLELQIMNVLWDAAIAVGCLKPAF